MDHKKVLKEIDDIIELSEIKSDDKNQNSSEKDDDKNRDTVTSDYSNFGSIGSNESFSKYVYDRTAPSFFMILAEQEISRQESLAENENEQLNVPQNLHSAAAIVDQKQLDEKLKTLEIKQDLENKKDECDDKEKADQLLESEQTKNEKEETSPQDFKVEKINRRETVRFVSKEEILGPKIESINKHEIETQIIDHHSIHDQSSKSENVLNDDEKLETSNAQIMVNQSNEKTPEQPISIDDLKVEKEPSKISFEHKAYDETMTFKMQPEVVDFTLKKQVTLKDEHEKYVFGSSKASLEKVASEKIEEYCECESVVPRSRSYGVLANIVLKTVSQYSIKRQMPLDEIRKQISMAEIQKEISSEEVSLLEAAVERIERCEELKTIDSQNDKGLDILIDYISKLYDVLKSILFGDQTIAQDSKALEFDEEEKNISEKNMTPNETSIEQLATSAIKEGEEKESASDKLKRILFGSHMQIRKEYESKICACSKIEEIPTQKKSEIEIENSDGILRTVRKSIKTAKSQESGMNEPSKIAVQSFDEIFKTVMSQPVLKENDNKNDESHLRKFKNEDDLTTIGVESSPSFVMRTSDIEDTASTKFVKYPKATISVLSVPSININQANVLKSSLLSKYINKKEENLSNAVIQDLNDDGYINLPKVPSNALSNVSSSAWIDENASFTVEEQVKNNVVVERVSFARDLPISAPTFSSYVGNQQQPTTSNTSEPSCSTTAAEKPKGKFRKCKCFLQRLTRPFNRGTKDDKKK